MFKKSLVALCLVGLSGCSLLAPQIDKAAKAAGKLVTYYCENVPDESVREEFRAKVNAAATPHSVKVTCVSGEVLETSGVAERPE